MYVCVYIHTTYMFKIVTHSNKKKKINIYFKYMCNYNANNAATGTQ